ncbi:MAG: CDP-alcohol phosphatidyltransferase family protein [Candidatus Omnitrophica bacterium]|nr:CDP-alcohol phosphatidyltransferase family protein [Candidatus Omnitrophota bacterium]
MNFANKISTFRIVSVPFFVACLVYYSQDPASREYLRFVALGIFGLGVISDAVDGYIARRAKQQSKAGLILDPLGDKLLLMSAFICLYLAPLPVRFPLPVILVVISRDILILLGAVVIFIVKQEINIVPTRWGKLTTTFQMASVILVLIQWEYAFVCWWTAVFFTAISGTDYVMRGFKTLYNNVDNNRNHH